MFREYKLFSFETKLSVKMSLSIFCLVKKCSEQIKDSSMIGYLIKVSVINAKQLVTVVQNLSHNFYQPVLKLIRFCKLQGMYKDLQRKYFLNR